MNKVQKGMYSLTLIALFLLVCYHLIWIVYGFHAQHWISPGDFPWEDVFIKPIADLMYDVSWLYEALRDSILGG